MESGPARRNELIGAELLRMGAHWARHALIGGAAACALVTGALAPIGAEPILGGESGRMVANSCRMDYSLTPAADGGSLSVTASITCTNRDRVRWADAGIEVHANASELVGEDPQLTGHEECGDPASDGVFSSGAETPELTCTLQPVEPGVLYTAEITFWQGLTGGSGGTAYPYPNDPEHLGTCHEDRNYALFVEPHLSCRVELRYLGR